MKALLMLLVGTAVGAGTIGAVRGIQIKDEILDARIQAREDSLAAVALASSAELLADSVDTAAPDSVDAPTVSDTTGVPSEEERPEAGAAETDEADEGGEASAGDPVDAAVPAAEVAVDAPEPSDRPEPDLGTPEQAQAVRELAAQTAERLSKIFAQMKPAEAAEVLSHLSDGEIERILIGIRERDAAAILGQLEPERAASVSRRVLQGGDDA